MPEIVLKKAKSYLYAHKGTPRNYTRGAIHDVPEGQYHDMIRTGYFADPHRQVDAIKPRRLGMVPNGHVVPVIRDGGMGDVLMAAVPLRDLAQRYPRLRFIYATHTHYVPLFAAAKWRVAEVMAIPELHGAHPYAVDLRSYVEIRPNSRTADRTDIFSHYLLNGDNPSTYASPIRATDQWRQRGGELAALKSGRPSIAYVPRASQPMRNWGLDYHRKFISLATAHGYQVVIVDRRAPKKSLGDGPLVTDLRGRLSIEQLAWVTSAVNVVVTPDTGNTHLAEALGIRCVCYFTSVDPRLRVSHYNWTRAVYPDGQLPCLNCTHTPRCRQKPPMPCALLSTPERVWREVEWIMAHEPPWSPYSWEGAPQMVAEEICIA